MKTIPEVITLINKKIEEHNSELNAADEALAEMKSKGMGQNHSSQIQKAAKQLILKDKIVFHKACILVLNDVKREIE